MNEVILSTRQHLVHGGSKDKQIVGMMDRVYIYGQQYRKALVVPLCRRCYGSSVTVIGSILGVLGGSSVRVFP